ncbi:MAG TPA: DUF3231 family protein [Symbiobacteriaceae bacterium]|nr:DUF3231 family protein [Symbiobacteriaceae bacterium]
MNILQGVIQSVTEPPHPLHVGQAFVVWALYIGVAESRVICQLLLNHTSDTDLKETIEHVIADVEKPLEHKLKHYLEHHGIGIPPTTGDKPRADEAQIPPGAKFTDAEIANLLVVKIEGMVNLCHIGIAQSVRDDIGLLLMEAYQHLALQGFTIKKTMQQRGWFRTPPLYPFSPKAGANAQ